MWYLASGGSLLVLAGRPSSPTYLLSSPTGSWDDAYALAQAKVAQMTIDEKVGVVTGQGQFSSRCIGNTHAVERLGIPAFCMNDGPAGIRAVKNVTGFPTGINAYSFSRRLMRARGKAIGEEFRGKGIHIFLGPAMDILDELGKALGPTRNWLLPPRYSGFANDFLSDTLMEKVGIKNDAYPGFRLHAPSTLLAITSIIVTRILATLTIALCMRSTGIHSCDRSTLIPERLCRLHNFCRLLFTDHVLGRCAYNRNNGTYSCGDPALLGPNGLLRKESNFRGQCRANITLTGVRLMTTRLHTPMLVSIWKCCKQRQRQYHNGSPLNRTMASWYTTLSSYELTGLCRYRFGQDSGFPETSFDAQKPDGSGSLNLNVNVRTAEHTALVKEIASASAVLLKNSRTGTSGRGLPLALPKSIAIIGQDAKKGSTDCRLNECNDGTMSIGWGSGSNSLDFLIPPYDAFVSRVAAQGNKTTISASLSNDIDAGVAAARGKDVAVVFANAGELGAWDLVADLWQVFVGVTYGRELTLSQIERVAAVNNNTIVVIHSVGPVIMNWVSHPNITGLIYAGAPGEQTGPSIVDVVYGDYNPQGRLPFAVGKSETDYNTNILYNSLPNPTISYTEKLLLDYKYMASAGITPLFDFGYGLTYGGKFDYSGLSITSTSTGYTVTFKVTNSGTQKATEIAQLYLGFPASAGEPPKNLRGFEEVPLEVGASSTVTLKLSTREISVWDTPSRSWKRPTGTFTAYVGSSHSDIRLQGTF
ncbi:glycoside hydrolase family 3 protein [Rhizoctonia solani AG-1 IA]|uniref:beta-glucosidase n=1 Tax=Thanatephorus cucumeris (strain AG1-IA) TaxID=983506 RepID=L8X693_THACA|nr:glycoside hydrolase family 3 protein [Rhizoctonia solani AG-1 IA]